MPIEKRSFFEGMNGDISPRLLSDKAALNIMNSRVAVTEFGRNARLENIPGTTLINQNVFPPYGVSQTIGSVPDAKNNRIIYFNYNSFGDHGIYAAVFENSSVTTYAVLYDSQVIGGLNFSKDSRISRNAKVIGNLLYWTDDLNEPRRLNIDAAILMNDNTYVTDELPYSYPMNPEVITIIRRPPFYAVEVEKAEDLTYANNFIANTATLFFVRYRYRDFEYSKLGEGSELVPYNSIDESENYVIVTMPATEVIDQDVIEADLVVQYGGIGKKFRIHTWTRADIDNHNIGNPLTYNFYNDISGEALSDFEANLPFDSVPIRSKTIETARNRNFLGNNIEGYDTPTITSMAISVAGTGGDGSYPANLGIYTMLFYETGNDVPIDSYTNYAAYLPGLGVYYYWDDTYVLPLPSTLDAGDAEVVDATNISEIGQYIINQGYIVSDYDYYTESFDELFSPGLPATLTVENVTIPLGDGSRSFKSEGSYGVGMVFFDKYRRKCGIVTNDELRIEMPIRTYNDAVFNTGIAWTVSNGQPELEIPDWAYFYAPVRTQNLQTRFFIQGRAVEMFYVTRDDNGVYDYTSTAWDTDMYAIGINISSIVQFGFGYVFTEGDLVKLFFQPTTHPDTELSIIGQDGKWILCQARDLGTLGASVKPLIEIYTPYKVLTSEGYYEVGQVFPVVNPTESNRSYSTTGGLLNGDVYILERGDVGDLYFTENMSPNDKFWTNWYTDISWINLIDKIGQQHKTNSISWSNTYVQGTKTNGLSTFDPLDERAISLELGEIQKLQLASRSQFDGTIMLCICTIQTASLYLQEVQLVAASGGNADIATVSDVIGTINVLKGMLGTQNPETVIEYLGLVFALDVNNGVFWQYSNAGLEAVSRYNQSRFFKRYCKEYLESSANNLDNINGFHHIPTCVDPYHKEIIVTLPALIYENYAEVLPSYGGVVPPYATSIVNRFDIFDSLGKTMAYQYEENKWGSNYEFLGEQYDFIENTMVGFKDGTMYIHNDDTVNWNKFYGVNYPVRTFIVGNLNPSALKNLDIIAIESNAVPDWTVAISDWPNTQITDLTASNYTDQEGVYYTHFFNDRLSPNDSGTADERLYTGDKITGVVLMIQCDSQAYDYLFWCNFIDIGYSLARGQKQIINPVNT